MATLNTERLRSLARDLRTTPPRSPRETLAGVADCNSLNFLL